MCCKVLWGVEVREGVIMKVKDLEGNCQVGLHGAWMVLVRWVYMVPGWCLSVAFTWCLSVALTWCLSCEFTCCMYGTSTDIHVL